MLFDRDPERLEIIDQGSQEPRGMDVERAEPAFRDRVARKRKRIDQLGFLNQTRREQPLFSLGSFGLKDLKRLDAVLFRIERFEFGEGRVEDLVPSLDFLRSGAKLNADRKPDRARNHTGGFLANLVGVHRDWVPL